MHVLCLEGLLPATYHRHFALLVCSMHILLGDNISTEELSEADSMLKRFCAQFEDMVQYLINFMHYVRHIYLHSLSACFW